MGGTTGSWTKEPKDKRLLNLQRLSGLEFGGQIQNACLMLSTGQKYNYSKGNPQVGRIVGEEGVTRDVRVLSLTVSKRFGSVLGKSI